MSEDVTSPLGERQGNLSPSANGRAHGKTLNFGHIDTARQLRLLMAHVAGWELRRRCDRLVAEIGPWMLEHRRRRAGDFSFDGLGYEETSSSETTDAENRQPRAPDP